MKSDNVFFVDFTEDRITIIHSKCGSEATQVPALGDDQNGLHFSCPVCEIETMYFLNSALAQVLAKLKKSPEKTKLVVEKCYIVDRAVLSSKEVMVLEKRTILE